MQIIQISKTDCPFCGIDGKVWAWNKKGGQSYGKCDHKIDRDIHIIESKKIIKEIAKLKIRHKEIKEILALKEDKQCKTNKKAV